VENSLNSWRAPQPGGLIRPAGRPPGVILDLPLRRRDGAAFRSADAYGQLCAVSGAIWTLQGRSFDAVDDYISVAGTVFNLQTFSAIFWVQPAGIGTFRNIFRGGCDANGRYGWALAIRDANVLRIAHIDSTGSLSWQAVGTTAVVAGQAYCVGCTCPGNGLRATIFVNGVAEGTATQTTIAYPAGATYNRIGYIPSAGQPFGGIIKSGIIVPGALSALEHHEYYLATKGLHT